MSHLIVALIAFSALGQSWSSQGNKEGVHLEARKVQGSAFEELRLTITLPATPAQVCRAIWHPSAALEHGFRRRDTLLETATERLTYEQIAAPLVSDRDYTLHVTLGEGLEGGCHIAFETQNNRGPAPVAGFVRIPAIRGGWDITRAATGGTQIVYIVYSEPGGGIPAFLTRGSQRTHAVEWMKLILSRVGEHAKS